MRPDWWPDWSGQAAIIVASGGSAKQADLSLVEGKLRVLAIKESWVLTPPDVVYGCDAPFWINARGLPECSSLKITAASEASDKFEDLQLVSIPDPFEDGMIFDRPGQIGSGRNSGFQALNLAVQFGARRIILIGIDANTLGGVHWYGRNRGRRRNNPDESNFKKWRNAFSVASVQLKDRNIDVRNASMISSIEDFPKKPLPDILAEWKL